MSHDRPHMRGMTVAGADCAIAVLRSIPHRLSGFDTPESGSRCERRNVHQAAAFVLSDFIGTRTVSCAVTGTDRYDRLVASCEAGGTDLGQHMVREGWARDRPRYSGGAYSRDEQAARAARRGLWGLDCPDDLWGGRSYD